MVGVLPEDFRGWPPGVSGSCLDPDHPVAVAIETTRQIRNVEQLRTRLAQDLVGVFDEDMKVETDRLLGLRSPNTTRAYKSAFGRFKNWCAENRLSSLPSTDEVIGHYIVHLRGEGTKPNTIERAISAIAYVHKLYANGGHDLAHHGVDFQAPVVRAALRWVRRMASTPTPLQLEYKQKAIEDGEQAV